MLIALGGTTETMSFYICNMSQVTTHIGSPTPPAMQTPHYARTVNATRRALQPRALRAPLPSATTSDSEDTVSTAPHCCADIHRLRPTLSKDHTKGATRHDHRAQTQPQGGRQPPGRACCALLGATNGERCDARPKCRCLELFCGMPQPSAANACLRNPACPT